MAIEQPDSMEDLVYFTRRKLENDGNVMLWVFKQECPKCHKAQMGKPVNEKTGKAKIRAKEYECPACHYTVEKEEYEEGLTANISYVCPHCKNDSEKQVPFKRKKVKGVETLRFECDKCHKTIDVTKKMKAVKK
ncbi:hypothetical protein GOV04_00385 [Candidatus Woesearchaeota archaeon]|nr:hypothetical protein [Candidatus Woesearchaeota archaeon]